MTERNHKGQFVRGNSFASIGGHARARALSPRRRKQIAKSGWRGLVRRQFGGDERAAKLWWGAVGAWAYDRMAGAGNGVIASVYQHPGQPSEFRARLYQLGLFIRLNDGEVDFQEGVR